MLKVIISFMAGGCIGFVFAALLCAAKEADEAMERDMVFVKEQQCN